MKYKNLILNAAVSLLLSSPHVVWAAPDSSAVVTTVATEIATPTAKETKTVKDNHTPNIDSNNAQKLETKLPNGLYLVFDESDDEKKLKPFGKQQLVVYDYEFFPLDDRDTASYLIISPEQFIPLKLGVEPQKEKDLQGKPKLMLQLSQDQIIPLEEFTTKNLGKAVAIMIGSKVVTKHKIKEAIKGGKMQITRCSDNGCDVLYTQLQQHPE
jgi:preprotein translocase subunit SecD